MRPLRFLFAVHCHQPVGNFGDVFERAFDDCYEPLLAEFDRHPGFKLSLHFSGPLLEYMERRRRGLRDLIGRLVGRGQVELLGGGFYEPVLAVIPRIEDPHQVALQSRHDRLLYVFSGVYFSMILAVLVLELLGITVISKLLTKLTS